MIKPRLGEPKLEAKDQEQKVDISSSVGQCFGSRGLLDSESGSVFRGFKKRSKMLDHHKIFLLFTTLYLQLTTFDKKIF